MSQAFVDQLRARYEEHAVEIVRRARPMMEDAIRQSESRRTGAMADATTVTEPQLLGSRVSCEARVDVDYARWQDEGTGVFGPTGTRIFPTHAKVLRFDWPAAGGVVFARSIAGSPGRHFFEGQNEPRWLDALGGSLGGPL